MLLTMLVVSLPRNGALKAIHLRLKVVNIHRHNLLLPETDHLNEATTATATAMAMATVVPYRNPIMLLRLLPLLLLPFVPVIPIVPIQKR